MNVRMSVVHVYRWSSPAGYGRIVVFPVAVRGKNVAFVERFVQDARGAAVDYEAKIALVALGRDPEEALADVLERMFGYPADVRWADSIFVPHETARKLARRATEVAAGLTELHEHVLGGVLAV